MYLLWHKFNYESSHSFHASKCFTPDIFVILFLNTDFITAMHFFMFYDLNMYILGWWWKHDPDMFGSSLCLRWLGRRSEARRFGSVSMLWIANHDGRPLSQDTSRQHAQESAAGLWGNRRRVITSTRTPVMIYLVYRLSHRREWHLNFEDQGKFNLFSKHVISSVAYEGQY